jgi:hypothetical protein
MRKWFVAVGTLSLVLALAVSARADVKSQQKAQVKFEGALGRIMNMFGGKAAKEGVVITTAVAGDRQMTTTDQSAELVDLAAEKVYRLDLKNKTYKVQTFAEIRKEWEDMQAKAKEQAAENKEKGEQPQYEIDVDLKKTGQQRTIGAYACQEVVTTITIRQKGRKLEDGGGMVMTANSWLAPKMPAMQEQVAFQQRYMTKLFGTDTATMARDMAQALAMYPQLKEGMARWQKEAGGLDGTPVLTTLTMESVMTAEQAQAQADKDKSGGGVGLPGGLGGMFGRKKKAEEPAKEGQAAQGPKTRATIMTTTTELLEVATTVAAVELEIPAGFKQK